MCKKKMDKKEKEFQRLKKRKERKDFKKRVEKIVEEYDWWSYRDEEL